MIFHFFSCIGSVRANFLTHFFKILAICCVVLVVFGKSYVYAQSSTQNPSATELNAADAIVAPSAVEFFPVSTSTVATSSSAGNIDHNAVVDHVNDGSEQSVQQGKREVEAIAPTVSLKQYPDAKTDTTPVLQRQQFKVPTKESTKESIKAPFVKSTKELNTNPVPEVKKAPQGPSTLTLGPVQLQFEPKNNRSSGLLGSGPMQILLALTALSLLPAILIAMTAFTRIIIVLAMVRHAVGMPETPPNTVLLALAMFLTAFTMVPVLDGIAQKAYTPYTQQQMPLQNAVDAGLLEMKTFMLKQTRMEDLSLMFELSKRDTPSEDEDVSLVQLVPAFMLSELRAAFQIGFVIFLPFLLIDLVVASALMALGMMMVPPITISLPLKILLFVLIDGWTLLVRALLGSFN